jgi:short-subunit dehydrogenase
MKGTAIITGAGGGIGYELCRKFAANGWKTIGISGRANSLNSIKGVHFVNCDIREWVNMDGLISQCDLKNDDSDFRILINNAGFLLKTSFESFREEEIMEMIKVNYVAPMKITQEFLPWLRQSSKAHIIYVGSMGGFQGSTRYEGLSVYSSTKSALGSLSESLAEEYRHTKMHFNTLALGAVDTEMLKKSMPNYAAQVKVEQMCEWIYEFSYRSYGLINGKVIPVAGSNPEI